MTGFRVNSFKVSFKIPLISFEGSLKVIQCRGSGIRTGWGLSLQA